MERYVLFYFKPYDNTFKMKQIILYKNEIEKKMSTKKLEKE